ncbi:MAG: EamA family transporter [Proteobacteria bacterium]|nr:EamA family transporter [Pseudomonadota bacterium]
MSSAETAPAATGGAWVEALLAALTLAVLNIAYGIAQRLGVNPVALMFWAMPAGAIALLAASGLGPNWRQIIRHPMSLAVGAGIIGMEAAYYVMLGFVSPADGSLVVRVGVPIALVLGYLFMGRRPKRLAVLGGLVILAAILWYVPRIEAERPLTGFTLGALCGLIVSSRSFAAERHPWNQSAKTIPEKMRVTGLVLLVASLLGVGLVLAAMSAAYKGLMAGPTWLPTFAQLFSSSAVGLGLFIGVVVLTLMQFFSFSVIVKLGTEVFVATTTLIPIATLLMQQAAMAVGLLAPIPVPWKILPALMVMMLGVAMIIAAGRKA